MYKKTNRLKKLLLSSALAFSVAVSGLTAVSASAVWVKSTEGYSYKDNETGEKLIGWQKINKKIYYFDKDGIACTGWTWVNGKRYYFIASDKGRMAIGWKKISGERYYFGKDGVVYTGTKIIGTKMYLFDKYGKLYTSRTILLGGKRYIIDENGVVTNRDEIEAKLFELDEPLKKLKWGMNEKEIAKAAGIKEYVVSDTQMAVPQRYDGAEQLTYYISEKNGFQCYSISQASSTNYYTKARMRLNDDWHKEGKIDTKDDSSVIVYSKDGKIALLMNDGKRVITFVISEKMSEGFFNGDKTVAQVLASAIK